MKTIYEPPNGSRPKLSSSPLQRTAHPNERTNRMETSHTHRARECPPLAFVAEHSPLHEPNNDDPNNEINEQTSTFETMAMTKEPVAPTCNELHLLDRPFSLELLYAADPCHFSFSRELDDSYFANQIVIADKVSVENPETRPLRPRISLDGLDRSASRSATPNRQRDREPQLSPRKSPRQRKSLIHSLDSTTPGWRKDGSIQGSPRDSPRKRALSHTVHFGQQGNGRSTSPHNLSDDVEEHSDEETKLKLPRFVDKNTLRLVKDYLVHEYVEQKPTKRLKVAPEMDNVMVCCDDDDMTNFMRQMNEQAAEKASFVTHHNKAHMFSRRGRRDLEETSSSDDEEQEEDEEVTRVIDEFVEFEEDQTLGNDLFQTMVHNIQKTKAAVLKQSTKNKKKRNNSAALDRRTLGWLRKAASIHHAGTDSNFQHPVIKRITEEENGRRTTRRMARQHHDNRQRKRKKQEEDKREVKQGISVVPSGLDDLLFTVNDMGLGTSRKTRSQRYKPNKTATISQKTQQMDSELTSFQDPVHAGLASRSSGKQRSTIGKEATLPLERPWKGSASISLKLPSSRHSQESFAPLQPVRTNH